MKTFWTTLILLWSASALAEPNASKNTEIRVTLFQQPCLLGGPFSEETLGTIHSISPEKIPPLLTLEHARQSLGKLKAASAVPSALEVYRDKLQRRLETQIAFEESLEEARKTVSTDPLFSAMKRKLSERQSTELKSRMKKIDSKEAVFKWTPAQLDSLREAFEEVLGPHPEEDFHRAIQRIKVQYTCNYGESVGE